MSITMGHPWCIQCMLCRWLRRDQGPSTRCNRINIKYIQNFGLTCNASVVSTQGLHVFRLGPNGKNSGLERMEILPAISPVLLATTCKFSPTWFQQMHSGTKLTGKDATDTTTLEISACPQPECNGRRLGHSRTRIGPNKTEPKKLYVARPTNLGLRVACVPAWTQLK